MGKFEKVPSVLMRGGTSKGLIIDVRNLPANHETRDYVISRIYGSPDIHQIDGVGGGSPLTSKVALIDRSPLHDIDIVYTFGQVSLDKKNVDYKPTCGNMSVAVGLYAVEEGFCELKEPITTVRIFNTNTKKIIEVEVPVENNEISNEGDYSIDGVPGTASRINVNFLDSGGAITGKLLPTGKPKDQIVLYDGRVFEVSVIDSANTVVFISAEQVNINGTETGEKFNQKELLKLLEEIRVEAGVKIGLIEKSSKVTPTSHALPKIAVLSRPQPYTTSTGVGINDSDIDIVGRYLAMGQLHQAFAVSGAIAVATAARMPGTIVSDLIEPLKGPSMKIGHPSGIIEVEVHVETVNDQLIVKRAALGRTARRIMEGYSLVPYSVYYGAKETDRIGEVGKW